MQPEKKSRLGVSKIRDFESADEQPATSEYDTAEPTDEEPEEDEVGSEFIALGRATMSPVTTEVIPRMLQEKPVGSRASALSVAQGAEYGRCCSDSSGIALQVLN